MTEKSTEKSKIELIRERRAAKLKDLADGANRQRELNEEKLGEIEEQTGKTLGHDLGVVWLPTGNMIVVQQLEPLRYEKYGRKINVAVVNNLAIDPQDIDGVLKSPTLVYPTGAELENWLSDPGCKDAKEAAAAVAVNISGRSGADFEGK